MAHILLVDDHPDLSDIVSQLLEAHGHTVRCCGSAEAALQELESERPQAVIADHRLPGMSGVELIRQLRTDAKLAGVSLLLCSADDSNREQALAAGACEFWVKGSESLFEDIDRLGAKLACAGA